MRRNITIQSDQSEACINISIIDDHLAMEGDEAFQVTMITPPNVPSSPPDTAMVIIKDNDSKSYGSSYLVLFPWIVGSG